MCIRDRLYFMCCQIFYIKPCQHLLQYLENLSELWYTFTLLRIFFHPISILPSIPKVKPRTAPSAGVQYLFIFDCGPMSSKIRYIMPPLAKVMMAAVNLV